MMDDSYKKGLEKLGYLLHRDVREPEQANFAWHVLNKIRDEPGGALAFGRWMCQHRNETMEEALYAGVCLVGESDDGKE